MAKSVNSDIQLFYNPGSFEEGMLIVLHHYHGDSKPDVLSSADSLPVSSVCSAPWEMECERIEIQGR